VNSCDHGHETFEEVRRLQLPGGAAAILCVKHFLKEMAFREAQEPGGAGSRLRWVDLAISSPAW
jgi:hypothetical protein